MGGITGGGVGGGEGEDMPGESPPLPPPPSRPSVPQQNVEEAHGRPPDTHYMDRSFHHQPQEKKKK